MRKILIADDEYMELEHLKAIVQRTWGNDVSVTCVENGGQAVDVALLWNPDVILMDIEMPVLSGLEAAKQILVQKPAVKIIFITAYSLFSYAQQAVKLGASDYVLKPVDEESLVHTILTAYGQIDAQAQLEAVGSLEGGDKAEQIVEKVKAYVLKNYMRSDLSLDAIASLLGINPSYLSGLFKKSTGVGFSSFVSDLRISKAKQLLADPLRSASEIAEMTGYDSSSYFTKAFKKSTGMTPTEYRSKGRP